MEEAAKMNPKELRQFLLNTKEPVLFNNINNWKILQWDLNIWDKALHQEKLIFRKGEFKYSKSPQWENNCKIVKGTLKELINFENNNPLAWVYFDYKYLNQWFQNIPEIKKDITWANFGFSELTANDSTIWIGSKGAHTPCHIDTYGCNLITQVLGRKRWILFPPDINLLPTRVPYEESSVYSKINFFSPDLSVCKGLSQARSIIINPGETLFVPQGWWHYVENLETAISINVWIPMYDDFERQLEESLVQLMAFQFTNELDINEKSDILIKPEESVDKTLQSSIAIIKQCSDIYNQKMIVKRERDEGQECESINKIFKENEDVYKKVPILSKTEWENLLKQQFERFRDSKCSEEMENRSDNARMIKHVLDAFLHPDVIALIKSKLIDSLHEQNL